MIRAVIAPLVVLLWFATVSAAQPVTDLERGLFVSDTYERIRTAVSEDQLRGIVEDIRNAGHLLDYESLDWLLDTMDEQRQWLDPVQDDVYWDQQQRLGELVEHRFRVAGAAPGVAILRAGDAEWQFYQEVLDWQSDNPGFSGMDRVSYGFDLMREIAEDPAFRPSCNPSGGLAFDDEGMLLMPCGIDQ